MKTGPDLGNGANAETCSGSPEDVTLFVVKNNDVALILLVCFRLDRHSSLPTCGKDPFLYNIYKSTQTDWIITI